MTNSMTHAAVPTRKLPPVAAPAEVADSGLIRVGAAVGRPAGKQSGMEGGRHRRPPTSGAGAD